MNRAVFDTNVVVSGFLSPHGPPGRIVEWLRSGRVQAVLDDRIAVDYSEVLARPSLGLPTAEVKVVLDSIRSRALWVEGAALSTVRAWPDPDTAAFLECALAAGVPLVTGNLRHFPKSATQNVAVITPARFVASAVRD